MAEPLLNRALGNTSMGPRPLLGPNHNSEKRASSIRSTRPFLEHLNVSASTKYVIVSTRLMAIGLVFWQLKTSSLQIPYMFSITMVTMAHTPRARAVLARYWLHSSETGAQRFLDNLVPLGCLFSTSPDSRLLLFRFFIWFFGANVAFWGTTKMISLPSIVYLPLNAERTVPAFQLSKVNALPVLFVENVVLKKFSFPYFAAWDQLFFGYVAEILSVRIVILLRDQKIKCVCLIRQRECGRQETSSHPLTW